MTEASQNEISEPAPPSKNAGKNKDNRPTPRRTKKEAEPAIVMIKRLLREPTKIAINGKTVRASTLQAILNQLLQNSLLGDKKARRVLLAFQEFAVRRQPHKPARVVFVDSHEGDPRAHLLVPPTWVYETIEGRQSIRTPRFLILRRKDSELSAEYARLHAACMTRNEINIGRAVCHQHSRESGRPIMRCRFRQRGV